MKKLSLVVGAIIISMFLSNGIFAQDSTFAYLPKEVSKFTNDVFKFIQEGNFSDIEKYISSSVDLVSGRDYLNHIDLSTHNILKKYFFEGSESNPLKFESWSSDGKYYYMFFNTYNKGNNIKYWHSIFIEVNDKEEVILKVWHKS
jgi:hypothetical protein